MKRTNFPILAMAALLTFAFQLSSGASDQIGTLTEVEGNVVVLSHPSKTLQTDTGTHASFEGQYYLAENAKVGSRIEQGNVLRTSPTGKARVVFDNGDQFNVGSGTAYRVQWDHDTQRGATQVNLMYGKIRGVIEKGGPRSHLQIRTKTVTMGVRGTDFFIADNGAESGTQVSVLRGAVELKPTAKAPSVQVKAGFSAAALPKTESVDQPIVMRQTTQQELQGISRSSELTQTVAATDPEIKAQIQKLETQATSTTLNDIKTYDPTLYEKIREKTGNSTIAVAQINSLVVDQLAATAPKGPSILNKPKETDLHDPNNQVYDKYFHTGDW